MAQHDAVCAAKLMGPGWQHQLVPRVPDPVQSQKGLRRAAGAGMAVAGKCYQQLQKH